MPACVLLDRILDATVEIEREWVHFSVPLFLADCLDSPRPWATADSLAARLGVSDDTARRWLNHGVGRGLVIVDVRPGARFYRITGTEAERVVKLIGRATCH